MKNKNILFTSPKIAEVVEKELALPKDDEVMVKIMRTTISAGTERANLVGDPNVGIGPKQPITFPHQSGYSASGVVVEVGKNVRTLKVGDRVACSWTVHAQYCNVKESRAYRLGDDIDFDEAALVHIGTFPIAAIRKCRLEIGESALVMGLGVLGLISVELLRAAGAVPIIGVDPVASKRAQAFALGADYALDPFAEGFAETVKQLTNGGIRVAIEITGNGKGLDMALDCMACFGRVALLGCTRNSDFSIDYYRKVHGPGITLVGAHTNARPVQESHPGWWTESDDAHTILKMISSKRIDFKCLIEEVHSPFEAPEVYSRLASERFFPIVQFDWTQI